MADGTEAPVRAQAAWRNWSGSVTASPRAMLAPQNEEELSAAIRDAPAPLRIMGAGHSFTPLVASEGTILDLAAFSGLRAQDATQMQATFGAATPLSSLTRLLSGIGQALPNMGDIDKQTMAGALGTATHGSGMQLGAYHPQLTAMRLVDGRGRLHDYHADTDQEMSHATGVTLGAFGALTAVTLQNIPVYSLRRRRTAVPLGDILADFESTLSAHRSAELFIVPFASHALLQTLDITDAPSTPRATEKDEDALATLKALRTWLKWFPRARRALIGSAMARVADEEIAGAWRDVYASDRQTRFNEMEYHLPLEEGPKAIRQIIDLTEKHFPEVYFPMEIRTVQADDFWLSPFYRRQTCSVAVHHDASEDPSAFFGAAEAVFKRFGGRPHWGKAHSLRAQELCALYPRFGDAMEVRRALDPDNRFVSPYMAGLFGL